MHIFITGGAGFIGSHLLDRLLGEGHSVHMVDDLSTGRAANIAHHLDNPAFSFDEADIVTWEGMWPAVRAADCVYHLAAVVGVRRVLRDPIRVMATNIAGTERVLRAAAASPRRPRVLLASTSEVYGFNGRPIQSEADPMTYRAGNWTRWSYAVTKLAGEHFANAYARETGLEITAMRFFNMIGPRQRGEYGMVLPNFVRQAVRGLPLNIYGDGEQTRSFCDVRDGVRMMSELAEVATAPGEVVNLGNDQEISINDLAKLVRRRADSSSPVVHATYAEGYGEHFDDIAQRRPDLTQLKSLIDFHPHWTLTDTIDELIALERAAAAPAPARARARAAATA
ncbi:MAG: NAD-dependent epimerase/dehydratase family protein [Thiohalocapsa sp.]